jgi:hypothetical protein
MFTERKVKKGKGLKELHVTFLMPEKSEAGGREKLADAKVVPSVGVTVCRGGQVMVGLEPSTMVRVLTQIVESPALSRTVQLTVVVEPT